MKLRAAGRAIVLMSTLICVSNTLAAVRFVDGQVAVEGDGTSWATAKKTVHAGLEAAEAGDQVWVAKGLYSGGITLKEGVELYGGFAGTESALVERPRFPRLVADANESVLDGGQSGSVVICPTGVTTLARIDGFTIRNGNAARGGGIHCYRSSPVIANNKITRNSSSPMQGGGIYGYIASPIIHNNVISDNVARYGGGFSFDGGAAVLVNNVVIGNAARSGGGIHCNQARLKIINNSVVGNSAASGGGGIWSGSGHESGFHLLISNTLVAFNSSGIYLPSKGLEMRSNCVYGNDTYDYSGYPEFIDPTGSNGNISVDPRLQGWTNGEGVHLQPDSPCIDQGDDSLVQVGWLDLDGQERIIGTHVDIGADEADGTVWPTGVKIIHVGLSGNDANDGTTWTKCKATIQAGIDAAAAEGGEVWVMTWRDFHEFITIPPSVHVYGGFLGWLWDDPLVGMEKVRYRRNWQENKTFLYGMATFSGGGQDCGIDGFNIMHAGHDGIVCERTSPIIANNTLSGGEGVNGIRCHESAATLVNNTIARSTCGVSVSAGDSVWGRPKVINCSIVECGTGVSGDAEVTNCILWGNSIAQISGNPTVTYCCVQYGYPGQGNIQSDPLFLRKQWWLGPDTLRSGSPCIDAGNNAAVPETIDRDVANQLRFVDDPRTPDSGSVRATAEPVVDIGAIEYQPVAVKRLFVDDDAAVGGDGGSWATAFRHLQDALASARSDTAVVEIWIAGGTYRPDRNATQPDGNRDKKATFDLVKGVALYGGFAGVENPEAFELSTRNLKEHQTILSGDLVGDDEPTGLYRGENSYCVVTADAVGPATILDGLTIYGADGGCGMAAGMLNRDGSPTLRHCSFVGHRAVVGFMYCYAEPGGGFINHWGHPVLIDCTFHQNRTDNGAAVFNLGGTIQLSGCRFHENKGRVLVNLSSDRWYSAYGPKWFAVARATLTQCVFVEDLHLYEYGVISRISNRDGEMDITQCTIITESTGGPYEFIVNWGIVKPPVGGRLRIRNSIIWNDNADYTPISNDSVSGSTVEVTHCCIVGGWAGVGNTALNPRLVNVDGGNVRLQPGSPCIDAGDNAAVWENFVFDLAGNSRFVDDPATADCPYAAGTCGIAPIVDMGAYEYDPQGDDDGDGVFNVNDQCGNTIPGVQVAGDGCPAERPGDCDRDGDVDDADMSAFIACATGANVPHPLGCGWADLDQDSDVDQEDFGVVQRCLSGANGSVAPDCGL